MRFSWYASEDRKALLDIEPGSIPLAREVPGNSGIPNVSATIANIVLGGGEA